MTFPGPQGGPLPVEDKKHSPLGFSQAQRYLNCAGSVREVAKLPPQKAGAYAEEGTDYHALGEGCLKRGHDAAQYIDSYIGGTRITKEGAESVQVYLDAVRASLTRMGTSAKIHVEHPADVSFIHKDLWGTMDTFLVVPFEHAEVFDYKHGVNPVEADCDQLQGYALYPWRAFDVETVTVTIVQPRAIHPDGPVRSKTYTRAELERIAERFKAGTAATEKPDAPLVAGPWCRKSYCPNQATCPALHKHAITTAQSDFAKADIVPPPPHTLTPEQLRTVLQQADTLEGWLKSVHAYALSEAVAGRPPLGFKVVEGRKGTRKWVSEGSAISALESAGYEPFEKVLWSPAVAEKAMGKADFKKLGDLVTQGPGKPELVPDSDKRPALPMSAQTDFTPITEDL